MDALDIEKWRFVSDRYDYISTNYYYRPCPFTSSIFNKLQNKASSYSYQLVLYWFHIFSPRKLVAESSVLLGLVLIGRATFVFSLSFLSNLAKKSQYEKVSFKDQVIFWFLNKFLLCYNIVIYGLTPNKFYFWWLYGGLDTWKVLYLWHLLIIR